MHHQTCKALFAAVFCIAFLVSGASGQQPNSPTASAIWGGVNGPPWPINVTVAPIGTLTYVVTGIPFQPYALVQSPAGVVAGAMAYSASALLGG